MKININADASVVFANKLEKVSRSALPVAVRRSLNSAAFDVKTNTMPKSAATTFTQRKKSFFKATSKVAMSKGFDINSMKSTVGFIGGEKNQAVRDLEEQEYGGSIGGRAFIPLKTARVSKNNKKSVAKRYQLSKLTKVRTIKSKRNLFKKAAIIGVGHNFIYKNTLFQIKSLKTGNLKLLPLYDYKKGRSAGISKTGFMKTASMISSKKLERFFVEEAKARIKRELK